MFNLIPKEVRFFDLFERQSEYIIKAAGLLHELAHNFSDARAKAHAIKEVEHQGDSVTHEIPAGPHRVRAHNTLFWKTHDIVLRPGEHARFRAVNRAGWGSFGFLMMLGATPLYLTFERET